jgi:hypothetical protein
MMIVLFCGFHVLSVGVYAIPVERSAHPFRSMIPFVAPYILVTSQWQAWNLFAPDPLRRIVAYRIETRVDDGWHEVARLDESTLKWWRRERQLKILSRAFDAESPAFESRLADRILQSFCQKAALPHLATIRTVRQVSVIPATLRDANGAGGWVPPFTRATGLVTSCR